MTWPSQQPVDVEAVLVWCLSTVYDSGPAWYQHWMNVSGRLGSRWDPWLTLQPWVVVFTTVSYKVITGCKITSFQWSSCAGLLLGQRRRRWPNNRLAQTQNFLLGLIKSSSTWPPAPAVWTCQADIISCENKARKALTRKSMNQQHSLCFTSVFQKILVFQNIL